jgi:dTDP-glucose 4,6-dehydratase
VQYSNLQVAELILSALTLDATRIDFVKDRLGHDFRYSINGDKMKEKFGFVAHRSLKEDIAELVTNVRNKNE